jgi:hypothetical protein
MLTTTEFSLLAIPLPRGGWRNRLIPGLPDIPAEGALVRRTPPHAGRSSSRSSWFHESSPLCHAAYGLYLQRLKRAYVLEIEQMIMRAGPLLIQAQTLQ